MARDSDAKKPIQQRGRAVGPSFTDPDEAYARGDGWFEIELDLRGTGNLNSMGNTGVDGNDFGLRAGRRQRGRVDVISNVEDCGWGLVHVNHVYVPLGEDSREKVFSSGQRTAIRGKIIGIYLFRRCEENRSVAQAPPPPDQPQLPPPPPGQPPSGQLPPPPAF